MLGFYLQSVFIAENQRLDGPEQTFEGPDKTFEGPDKTFGVLIVNRARAATAEPDRRRDDGRRARRGAIGAREQCAGCHHA